MVTRCKHLLWLTALVGLSYKNIEEYKTSSSMLEEIGERVYICNFISSGVKLEVGRPQLLAQSPSPFSIRDFSALERANSKAECHEATAKTATRLSQTIGLKTEYDEESKCGRHRLPVSSNAKVVSYLRENLDLGLEFLQNVPPSEDSEPYSLDFVF